VANCHSFPKSFYLPIIVNGTTPPSFTIVWEQRRGNDSIGGMDDTIKTAEVLA
jgi:hypothetical protein